MTLRNFYLRCWTTMIYLEKSYFVNVFVQMSRIITGGESSCISSNVVLFPLFHLHNCTKPPQPIVGFSSRQISSIESHFCSDILFWSCLFYNLACGFYLGILDTFQYVSCSPYPPQIGSSPGLLYDSLALCVLTSSIMLAKKPKTLSKTSVSIAFISERSCKTPLTLC